MLKIQTLVGRASGKRSWRKKLVKNWEKLGKSGAKMRSIGDIMYHCSSLALQNLLIIQDDTHRNLKYFNEII